MLSHTAKAILALASLLLTLTGASLAAPQIAAGGFSVEFAQPGLEPRVFALDLWQGRPIAGGEGLVSNGKVLGSVAVFNGVTWDPLGSPPDGKVRAFAIYQGELYAAGRFESVAGQAAFHIARWTGTQWLPVGQGIHPGVPSPENVVFVMTVYQGELWVGGHFQNAGGQASANLARWDGSNWHALPIGVQGPGTPTVRALHRHGTDLYIAGEFGSVAGMPAQHLARLDSAGTYSEVGGGLFSAAYALESYAGDLYVGGGFEFAGGTAANKIARWDGNTLQPLGTGIPDSSIATSVFSLAATDEFLYVGGNFLVAGGISTRRLARWDGMNWSSADGVHGTDIGTTVIALQPLENQLLVGGEFQYAGAAPTAGTAKVSTSVALLDGNEWRTMGRGLGLENPAQTLVTWNDRLILGGDFRTAGEELSPRLVAFDGAGFETLGFFSGGNVNAAIVFQGDLVVTGSFSSINGVPIAGTARYDGTQWIDMAGGGGMALGVHAGELYGGGFGGVVRWTGTQWTNLGFLAGSVACLESYGGLLWVGGYLNAFGSGPGPHLVTWDGTSFQTAPGGAADDRVDALAVHSGELVVGGGFQSIGGQTFHHIARWNGSTWSPMAGGIPGPSAFTVLELESVGNHLYAGGSFTKAGGAPGDNVIRWNGAGWEQLHANGVSGYVTGIEALPNTNSVVIAGGFLRAGTYESRRLARWYADEVPLGLPFCNGGFEHGCPCGNQAGEGGCENAAGQGARLSATGSVSIANDDLTLQTSGLTPGTFALTFVGTEATWEPIPLGNGLRCLAGTLTRVQPIAVANGNGLALRHAWLGDLALATGSSLVAGTTWHVQDWYRDPGGPCGETTNVSNALQLTLEP